MKINMTQIKYIALKRALQERPRFISEAIKLLEEIDKKVAPHYEFKPLKGGQVNASC